MHVFGAAIDAIGIERAVLVAELSAVAAEFGLDPRTAWHAVSPSGRVHAAGVHHAPEAAARRRYVSISDRAATFFDGLPVARQQAGFDERDSSQLGERWEALPESLEGFFCAVHLDLERDSAEVLLDPLGLVPAFVARCGRGYVLSNSAVALSRTIARRAPDGVGVASFLGLGWASGRRTLVDGVTALEGGAVHRIKADRMRSSVHFGPATLANRARDGATSAELARELIALTTAAKRDFDVLKCPLTAGRDTRVLAALLIVSGGHGEYYTDTLTGALDVEIAQLIARHAGLHHRVTATPDQADPEIDWSHAADGFLARVDGLSSFQQLADHLDLREPLGRLGLKLWGVGGEIGRAGTGDLVALGANLPLARRSVALQRRLLAAKVRGDGLLTPAARDLLNGYLDEFIDVRLAEGWETQELGEAFYAFERVGCWGLTGPRRAAATADMFSPFCTRPFIDYCFSRAAGARYVEGPHYELMSELSPELRDLPYQQPWRPQHPRLAGAMASLQLAGAVGRRVAARRRRSTSDGAAWFETEGSLFVHRWVEARLELIRETCLGADGSVWELIDRGRLEALLAGSPEHRIASFDGLIRAISVCWFLNRTVNRTASARDHVPQAATSDQSSSRSSARLPSSSGG